eukprot:m.186872 g.186872  ORF g.186872 m.186872 type:complete len:50 (+) comp15415_c0_seq1:2451-2600(+)
MGMCMLCSLAQSVCLGLMVVASSWFGLVCFLIEAALFVSFTKDAYSLFK